MHHAMALAAPIADWNGPGPWILLVPLVWFALALVFVLLLRRFAWGRGWGPGCGHGRGPRDRRWEEDDGPRVPPRVPRR